MSVPFLCCHHHQTLAIPLSAASSASSPYLPPFFPRLHTFVLLPCLPSISHAIPAPAGSPVGTVALARQEQHGAAAESVSATHLRGRHPLGTRVGTCVFGKSVSATRLRGRHPLAPASAPAFLATSHGPQYDLHPLAQSAPVGTRSAPAAKTARRCSQKRFRNTPARSAPAGTRVGTRVFCNKS